MTNVNFKPSILIVSSMPPSYSANLGGDIMNAFLNSGYKVDFLTAYKSKDNNENVYSVYDFEKPIQKASLISRLKRKIPILRYIHYPPFIAKMRVNRDYIRTFYEDNPPISVELLTNKIVNLGTKYNVVITLFWEYMLTSKSLLAIYDALHCPIFIFPVDFIPMTGGCFYTRDCNRYMQSCGCCPCLNSNNPYDQTFINWQIKKDVFSRIDYVIFCNTWMSRMFKKSSLHEEKRINKFIFAVSEKNFQQRNKDESRKQIGISQKGKFILFAGAKGIKYSTKGFNYLVESVNRFVSTLNDTEKSNVLLMLAGKDINAEIKKYFNCEVLPLGFLNTDNLCSAYCAADVFLCTSVQDAGPSMVNQSLMCGTPIVAFEIGTAIDVVITGKTGYLSKYCDSSDFANGIKSIYDLSQIERNEMSNYCRRFALDVESFDSLVSVFENTCRGKGLIK